jgi:hypothetical protein
VKQLNIDGVLAFGCGPFSHQPKPANANISRLCEDRILQKATHLYCTILKLHIIIAVKPLSNNSRSLPPLSVRKREISNGGGG